MSRVILGLILGATVGAVGVLLVVMLMRHRNSAGAAAPVGGGVERFQPRHRYPQMSPRAGTLPLAPHPDAVAVVRQAEAFAAAEQSELQAERIEIQNERAELQNERIQLQEERMRLQEDRGKLYVTAEQQVAEIQNERIQLQEERARLREERGNLYVAAEKQMAEIRAVAEERKAELARVEDRIDRLQQSLEERAASIAEKEAKAARDASEAEELRAEWEKKAEERRAELARIAGMTETEARTLIADQVREDAKRDAMRYVRELEERARDEAEKRARRIITLAIQRLAAAQVSEATVSLVSIPSEEMKGRIIGKEGRNIRSFEQVTGVNLIIDDTPDAVLLSCFDPVRREMARICLEELIGDGRIHPARIEEVFAAAREKIEVSTRQAGEWAVMEVGIADINPELVRALGRLKYRTSYGQNVLDHLVETAHIAGMMAAELGMETSVVKRGALLHDIGKALTHEVEGSHAIIGAELARRLGESAAVCHVIESHHGEVEQRTVEAVLAQAADQLSGARPGARRESLESYVKRLNRIEAICLKHPEVVKAYAMHAGRDVRVMVSPDGIDDIGSQILARDIAKEIEEELEFPGQIRVTVIRETRAIEYAK